MPSDHQPDEVPDATAEVAMSVVIPAFNEAERLPPYLESIRAYLGRQFGDRYEVVVVDDGSTDSLVADLRALGDGFPQLRIICHEANRGKGAAVRTGMLAAVGQLVLFVDADGATPIEEERRLRELVESGADVAIGSRRITSGEVQRQRHPIRACVGHAFARFAQGVLGLSVRDTQCGFKMLRREAARRLFGEMREDGYYFDLELLIRADASGYRIREVPINWADRPGSRMSFARELPRMAGAFWRLRRLKMRLRNVSRAACGR